MATLDFAFLGDIVLDVPDADHWISGIASVTRAADIAIAHLEVPHTSRGEELEGDVPAPGADPAHLEALARAGIDAVSLAGNHMSDCGRVGIVDTRSGLDKLGIAYAGAGVNLEEAKQPAVLMREGRRIGFLSYNCVGPEISWATEDRAGCAYIAIAAADGGPSRPQAVLAEPNPASLALMTEDIAKVRDSVDLLIVALHKGITHRPAELAAYERPVAQAAIDAGADIVIGHHAHIAKGIEIYRGKPIFHGLGNGVVVTNALSPGQDHPARAEWVERRKKLFGFEPDPAYTLAPFHPDAVNGLIGRVLWHDDGSIEAGFTPFWSEPPGRPILPETAKAEAIAEYINDIGTRAGLPRLRLSQVDDRFVIGAND